MGPSLWQILIILFIILIIFGAGKLPKVMSDLGRGIKSFKEGLSEENSDLSEKKEVPKKIEKK